MTTLEAQIHDAIDRLEIPKVDLSEAVLSELPTAPRPQARNRRAVSIAMIVFAVAAILVITPTREAIADWLGIGATEIEPVDEQTLPDEPSVESLGEPVATTAPTATEPIVSPGPIPSLGQPVGVFDDESRGRSYAWASSETLPAIADSDFGAVLSVRPADRLLSTKQILSDTEFGPVEVAGLPSGASAFWIAGEHVLVQAGSSRPVTANQVLLWVDEDVEFRLETALPFSDVARLAGEIQDGTDLLAPG